MNFSKKSIFKRQFNLAKFAEGKNIKTKYAMIREMTDRKSSDIRKTVLKALEGKKLDTDDKEILQAGWPELFGQKRLFFIYPKKFEIIRNLSPKYAGKKLEESDREKIAMDITGADITDVVVAVAKAKEMKKLSRKEREIIDAGWPDIKAYQY